MEIRSQPITSLNLIRTKFYRPRVGAELVHRSRLIDLLDRGRELPLTLVSAPAGSGKTTLLSDWLASCPCPSAWLSLDEGDGDLAVFLHYLIAAIRTIAPGACEQTLALLQAAELPPLRVLAGTLINEIEDLADQPALAEGKRLVLVLDDYHLVTGQAINELLIEILRHPPQTLRLVLATRSDPALSLANLRARGQVLEIRRHELRFSVAETQVFLDRSIKAPVSQDVVAFLTEQMEGWITGLHLAALNLRQVSDPDAFLVSLKNSDRYVMDYLLDEVLSLQPPLIQEFLLKTSILARLNGPQCEAVTGLGDPVCDGQAYLEWLGQANLFIVALDNQRQWYRYHHLFRQLLQNRLERQADAGQLADLHRRASAWYARNGSVEDAIAHALHAGDEAAAVEIVEAHRHEAMNQERWQQLEQWLRLMPRRLIDERPELLLLEAWLLAKQWRIADLPPHLDRIEALLESVSSPEHNLSALRGEVDALWCSVWYYTLNGERTYALASRALQTLPLTYSSARGIAWMYYGAGLQAMGDIQSAFDAIHDGLKEDLLHGNAFSSQLLIVLCVLHWIKGDLAGLNQTATHFLRLAEERHLVESLGWARYFRGCAAYQSNDLAAAENDFAAVLELRYLTHGQPFSQSAFGLASIYLAQGAGEQARALVESVADYGLEVGNTRVLGDARAFQAWLALKQRRRAEAHRWAEGIDRNAPLVPMITFHVYAITLAEILLDRGTATSLLEAYHLLARLRSSLESQCNTRYAINVLALQALVADALGDKPAALQALQQAVTLAEPGGLLRVFVDLGPKMAELLVRLNSQDGAGDWVDCILGAFPAGEVPAAAGSRLTPSVRSTLVEPLTSREIEVLELLSQRLSAKEIAQRLVISDRTVKRHVANIYQKLGVNSRQQAIGAGVAHGVLSTPGPTSG